MDHDAMDRRMLKRLAPWTSRASALIRSKVADARAHAEKAITESAKAAPDGRATFRLVRRSRSFDAALARLAEAATDLAGPSVASTMGLIRDARRSFYVDSFDLWKEVIPSTAWVKPDADPTERGRANAAAQQVGSQELRTEIAGLFDSAGRALIRAANAAASRSSLGTKTEYLATWETQQRDAITRSVIRCLSDSDGRSHALACLDLIHPDLQSQEDLSLSSHDA